MRRNHYDLPHVGFGPFSLILVPRVGPRKHTAAPPISCRRCNDMRNACSALRTGRWEPGTHGLLQGVLTDTSRGTHGYSRADRRSIDWPQRTRRCGRPQETSRTVGVCARREDSAVQRRCPRDAPHCRRAHGWCSSHKTCSGRTPPTVTRERCAYSARTWGNPSPARVQQLPAARAAR